MLIVRTDAEIEDLEGDVIAAIASGGSVFPVLTYEEGIRAVLDWLRGETQQHPMREED